MCLKFGKSATLFGKSATLSSVYSVYSDISGEYHKERKKKYHKERKNKKRAGGFCLLAVCRRLFAVGLSCFALFLLVAVFVG